MTQATIFAAIEAQLATLPTLDPANTAWIGRNFQSQAETPYIASSMPALRGDMLSLGPTGVYQWKGVYQVACAYPIGSGSQQALAQADGVRALFPNATILETSDGFFVKFFAPDPKPLLQDGAWVQAIVQFPWLCHEITS